MGKITALIILAALLSGCAQMAESLRRAEAERQERARQCAAQGWVTYKDQCMSPQDARAAQDRDFIADQAERNRKAMLQAACIQRGGTWYEYSLQCVGGSNDVNVNVRRY